LSRVGASGRQGQIGQQRTRFPGGDIERRPVPDPSFEAAKDVHVETNHGPANDLLP
jgi:hypothetical protein